MFNRLRSRSSTLSGALFNPYHLGPGQYYPSAARTNHSAASLVQLLLKNEELDLESAQAELRWIQEAVNTRAQLISGSPNVEANNEGQSEIFRMVQERSKGMPIQYLLGDVDFGPLTLKCRPPTLIPRPETAFIFTKLVHRINQDQKKNPSILDDQRPLRILDLCTGSGAIPLLLAYTLPRGVLKSIHGIDLSRDAIMLARENLEFCSGGRPDVHERISFSEGDIFSQTFINEVIPQTNDDARRRLDLIVSNPPYISPKAYSELPHSVKRYEDVRALMAEKDGLAFYHRIAELLPELLQSSLDLSGVGKGERNKVAVEIGFDQSMAVQEILLAAGDGKMIRRTECWKDQFGKDRMVLGWG